MIEMLSKKNIVRSRQLYLLILPSLVYFIVFHYAPMYGVQIAFKDFIASKGIFGSPWVGLEHFMRFFSSFYFWQLIKNTIGISILSLIANFPFPIILALLLNEVKEGLFKRTIQIITYAPHFISTVVLVGIILAFLSPQNGIINQFLVLLGGERVNFMVNPRLFKPIYVLSGIWQHCGWGSIIYLAALSNVDIQLHESAMIDGASRLQRIWHINIPGIIPTMIILLILNAGFIMNVGFEKVFLLQNPLNIETSEVISTYVYKVGLLQAQYSFSAAVGMFNSVINFTLLVIVNRIARYASEISLW